MDSLASEDTTNAPGAVSDEMIHAENEQIEEQPQEAQGRTTSSTDSFAPTANPPAQMPKTHQSSMTRMPHRRQTSQLR